MEAFLNTATSYSEEVDTPYISPRFSIVKAIAKGGTSTIYLAHDTVMGCAVVLKVINSDLLASEATKDVGIKETELARDLTHPSLVRIYDLCRDDQGEYIVMEYLPGSSLKSLLGRNKFSYAKLVTVLDSLVDGLSFLHQKGLIHSDVKPSNVIVTKNNQVKLIDFANCRQDSKNRSPEVLVRGDQFFGYSLDYSSPQVINDEPATQSDDVFSLGCLTYEVLTGCSPIATKKLGKNQSLLSVKKPEAINLLQWYVLKRAMQADNKKRFQSVKQFYRLFKVARNFPYYLVGCIAIFLSIAFVALSAADFFKDYSGQVSSYQSAFDQRQAVDQQIASIRQHDPLERYKHLNTLESHPELLKEGAKATLYNDVVSPQIERLEGLIAKGITKPEMDAMGQLINALEVYYPKSTDLQYLERKLANERKLQANSLFVHLLSISDNGPFDQHSGMAVKQIARNIALLEGPNDRFLQDGYGDTYNDAVRFAVETQDWHKLQDFYAFSLYADLPEFRTIWVAGSNSAIYHGKKLSNYLYSKAVVNRTFPEKSVMFFLEGQLADLDKAINKAWYNKEIRAAHSDLLQLAQEYRFPAEFSIYNELVSDLQAKLKKKIRFHQRRNQFKSAASLKRLLNELDLALNK